MGAKGKQGVHCSRPNVKIKTKKGKYQQKALVTEMQILQQAPPRESISAGTQVVMSGGAVDGQTQVNDSL